MQRQNQTKRESKSRTLVLKIMLFAVGLGMIAGGIFIKVNAEAFFKNNPKTISTVSRFESRKSLSTKRDGTYKYYKIVFVKFNVGSNNYEAELDLSNDSIKKGDTFEIYYDKNNPYIIHTKKNRYISAYSLIGVGIFVLIFSIVLFSDKSSSSGDDFGKDLRNSGQKIYGRFLRVEKVDLGNGVMKFFVVVMINDPRTNEERKIKSDAMDNDISEYLMRNENIPVYVNMSNTDLYYIDTEEILDGINIINA